MSILLMQPHRKPGNQPPGPPVQAFWSLDYIAHCTGAPIANLETYWLPISKLIPTDFLSHIAALANGATEVGSFEPINEYGDSSYFFYMYDINSPDANRRQVARELGNIYPGDGVKFHGRGIIQLTGRGNNTKYGNKLGIDLVNNPDLALEPTNNALIFNQFMRDNGTFDAAQDYNWRRVRSSVNGGYNGWDKFIGIVNCLLAGV